MTRAELEFEKLVLAEEIKVLITLIDQVKEIALGIQHDLENDPPISEKEFKSIFGKDIEQAKELTNSITTEELKQAAEEITGSFEYQWQKTQERTKEIAQQAGQKAKEVAGQAGSYLGSLFSDLWQRGKSYLRSSPASAPISVELKEEEEGKTISVPATKKSESSETVSKESKSANK